MKTAIIHDWLTGMRGGEQCLEVFCELFPDAAIFTLLHNKGTVSKTIEKMPVKTSFIQQLPGADKKYRSYLPLFPAAVKGFDLSGYDLILSSSHCVAKGVNVPKEALHICYCYTPMRYAWLFFDEYFGNMPLVCKEPLKWLLNRLRRWDLKVNENVDFFIAISDNIKKRISDCYKRDSDVIYPPVSTDRFELSNKDEGFYLVVSALVPYKRVDIAVEAFNSNGKRLIIIGSGNSEKVLRGAARPNIEFLGWLDNNRIEDYYSRCKALIFPGEEDFGIVPVEAQCCGKPVIAYAKGGALETVVPLEPGSLKKPTGVFFHEQSPKALAEAIEALEKNISGFEAEEIRKNALRFDRKVFKNKIRDYIEAKVEARS